jgi:hypothetical protein
MTSPNKERSLLTLHGATILLLGLLAGLPAVSEELADLHPTLWRAAHGALLLAGVWLLASAALLPTLALPQRQRTTLTWSLLTAGYAFTAAVLIQAVTGVRALAPHGTISSWVAYLANLTTVAAGILAALLTALGAKGALSNTQEEAGAV